MIKNYEQKITNINDRMSNYFINRDKIIDSNDIMIINQLLLNNYNDIYIRKVYDYYKAIRDEFNKGNIIYNCGMIGGLGQFAFVLKEFSIITGLLKDFSKSVDNLFFKITLNLLKNYEGYKSIHYNFYDIIGGLSGDLYYFLDNNFEQKGIENIIKYLVSITIEDNKFFIKREMQKNDLETINFPHGHLNFGMAHGIISIAIVLAKAKSKGYNIKDLDNAIEKILAYYKNFCKKINNVLYWPIKLNLDDLYNKKYKLDLENYKSSWCNGNLGILRGLIKTYSYLGYEEEKNFYIRELINLLCKDDLNLNISNLCHGYSSVISIIDYSFSDKYFRKLYLQEKLDIKDKFIELIINEITKKGLNSYIDDIYFGDISFLQGFTGVYLTLNNSMNYISNFGKLIMID